MNDKINELLTEEALKEKSAKDEAYEKNLDQVVKYQVVSGWEIQSFVDIAYEAACKSYLKLY